MRVQFKYMPVVIEGGELNLISDRMRIVLHSDHILDIHDTGIRVFDTGSNEV